MSAAAAAAAAANSAVDALKHVSSTVAPVQGGWGSSHAAKGKPDAKTVMLSVPKQSPREVREATLVQAPPQSRSVARPLRSSDSALIQAQALQPSDDALARDGLTKRRRKKRRKKQKKQKGYNAAKQARDVHAPGAGGGKILPKKIAKAGQNTDKQKMKALELWTTARVKTKAVTTTAATLTDRQRRQAARQIHRSAESERWDVEQVYKEIFWSDPHHTQATDTLARARKGAMDRDHWRERCAQNPYLMDKLATIDGVTRKLRATFTRLSSLLGNNDWDSVFAHYDTDNSGGVDRNEFLRAVRVDAKVSPSKLTDQDLDELFNCIDTGDGLISPEELRLFLSVKKDMSRREMSGKLKERHDAKQRGNQANNKAAIFVKENGNDTERNRGKATMFVAEFIAVAKVRIRAGSSLSSPETGFLEPGETVVVTAVDRGYRLRVLRLKWGVSPTSGWVSERLDRGEGRALLEKLPRDQWSAGAHHETSVAERISQLREMYRIYTFMGTKQLDAEGKVQDESTSPRLSKERQFASQVIGGCGGDIGEIEALVTRLEQTPRAWWLHMLAEEWPHALQALSNGQLAQHEQEDHTEAPLQPMPPSAAPRAAAVSARRRPVSASAASGASTAKPENVEACTGDEGAASVDESETDPGALEQTGSTELSMQPAPPTGSRPAGSVPTARIPRESKFEKIDDVLRRYSPRRNPDRVAVGPIAWVDKNIAAGVQTQVQVRFVRDQRLRGDGTTSVDLPRNWASPLVQLGGDASTADDRRVGVGVGDLEKENKALRKNLELLEENASLRRRIDDIES